MKPYQNSLLFVIPLLAMALFSYLFFSGYYQKPPIKVGILHSLTGTMAISEQSVKNGTLLAIQEINKKGGVLGRKIEPVVRDGQSDESVFASEAEKLLRDEKVEVIFGAWTSASRKTLIPILEKYQKLLFYPVQYEGLESSPYVVYTGAAPNQQIIPAVKWAFDHLGKTFFLVGSDYIFPRTANAIIKEQVKALRGEVIGEEYILLGSSNVSKVVEKIKEAQPKVILNTINGDANIAFFKELYNAGLTSDQIPSISFSIAEVELKNLNSNYIEGNYAAWNYFQSIDSPANYKFVHDFKKAYGENSVTDDPIEAGYFGVYLWANAVQSALRTNTEDVRKHLSNEGFEAPEGVVYIDPENQHTWKIVRIGKIRSDRQFDIIWSSGKPVRPVPYPIYKSKEEWNLFLNQLHLTWKGQWANPGNL